MLYQLLRSPRHALSTKTRSMFDRAAGILRATAAALQEDPLRVLRGMQDPGWHPEGDVFVHTGHVCDVAVEIRTSEIRSD